MSLVETGPAPSYSTGHPAPSVHRFAFLRLYRSELRLVFGRRRNLVLLAGLAVVPILIGVAVRLSNNSDGGGGGPAFIGQITENGLFLVFTALVTALPIFLPLTVGIVSGDALAGESSLGTLRYLLTVPVSRGRLLLAKGLGAASFACAAVATVALVGLLTGMALFPIGSVTLLSGDTVSLTGGLLRAAGVGAFVAMSLLGLVAVGLFISTLTEVPVAAMAGTVVFAAVCLILDGLPQLSAIHPVLLTHHWFDFGELLRLSPDVGSMQTALAVQAAYVAIFGALAWSRFRTADVSS